MLKKYLKSILVITFSFISCLFCFSQENQIKDNKPEEIVYESTVLESTKYEQTIHENLLYEKSVYEIDINQYEFSEYIDNMFVSVFRTQGYINERVQSERRLKIGEITANLAIGTVVTIPILLVVPPMKVVTDVLIGMAIDAAISGTVSYLEAKDNTREILYGAIEGAADGFKWGAITSLAIEGISVAKRSVRNTDIIAKSTLINKDETIGVSNGLYSNADNISNTSPIKTEIQMPVRLFSIDETRTVIIPNKVKNAFRSLPDPKRPPRGYSVLPFDNTKRLIPAKKVQGDVISYNMFISKNGENVIAGNDGVLYYLSGENILPFNDVPDFVSRGGYRSINMNKVGQNNPDGVYYVERIIYTENGELARWSGPLFENVKKFDVIIPKEIYQATDTIQFSECDKQLKAWVIANPELASKRFTINEMEMIKETGKIKGFIWHHTSEPGRMQLVPLDLHVIHRHTGGREIWGGGSSKR